VGAKLFFKCY